MSSGPQPPAEWLIRDGHTGMWWRPGGNGYTREMLEAGLFPEAQARRVSSPSYAGRNDTAVHVSNLRAVASGSAVFAALVAGGER